MAKSYLVLEDGTVFEGEPFGYEAAAFGEVVFSTGMSGYQESLTDPSYEGQILVMTYPLVGNYGISDDYYRSDRVHTRGLVVREYCKEPSPMYGGRTLDDFLKRNKVPGISGIDTRDLVIKIRSVGTLRGAITGDKEGIENLIKELKRTPFPSESNLVGEVSVKCMEEHDFGKSVSIGLLDCGERNWMLRDLSERFNVTVFPYDTPADVIIGHKMRGVIVSNGPGDPSHPEIKRTVAKCAADLSATIPLFGIGLGSQIVGVALGGKTYKMKFGHRGSNQPVKYGRKVFITAQNHGFALEESSLSERDILADQINVNDGTVEGIRHKDLPIFTSQYRPEASPGPWDTSFLLDRFEKAAKEGRR
ncbi:MAG: glutamine-hydrolyzing carbamoyl-phosphate synthase small subunit [Methanomassiliicoccaceae archaeon]|nr:glutamine-hydrolyzing carbamoyl-phosphate synthase small subunit [Methanomassiliicoccaceae archaeon]